jgi:hypothetical protein
MNQSPTEHRPHVHVFVVTVVASLLTLVSSTAGAQTETADEVPVYENNDQVPYPDNTGALGTGDNSADITAGLDSDTTGALKGEITLKQREGIIEVFSNGNLVEQLVDGVGSTGAIKDTATSAIRFEPTGRPELSCPAQEHAGWFGPCTIEVTAHE